MNTDYDRGGPGEFVDSPGPLVFTGILVALFPGVLLPSIGEWLLIDA